MTEFKCKINADYTITVPEAVRDALSLSPGDWVSLNYSTGQLRLEKSQSLAQNSIFNTSIFSEWASEADEMAYAKL